VSKRNVISEKTNLRRLARHCGIQASYDDLWLEALPRNVPGTWQERPNWQRKAR